jgi:hypothetical protein
MKRILFFVLPLLFACSMSADTSQAEKEIPLFHRAFNAKQFEYLYDNGSEDLKKAVKKNEFVSLLEAFHRKLGDVSATNKISWKVNYHTSGTFVMLVYDTTFSEGKGTEQFVYRLADKQAKLVGYYLSSNVLVTK